MTRTRISLVLGVTALWLGITTGVEAAAVRPGLFNSNNLPRNDDGSTGLVNVGFTLNYFGFVRNQLFVNNNGNVTFNAALSTYTPFPINTTNVPIIAPFFADVDTRGARSDIVRFGNGTVDGRQAFGVNYVNVGFYNSRDHRLNSFQLVLINRSDIAVGDFDIEFNYDRIIWEAGQASGSNGDGLGGSAARAGYANGTQQAGTFFELAGSGVNSGFLDSGPPGTSLIRNRLNSNLDGRYVFNVRGGVVSVPEPGTLAIASIAGLGLLGYRLRRRQSV